MLKLSKIILEIKNISPNFVPQDGKLYDLKVWWDGGRGDYEAWDDIYEPYPGTKAGDEGWYWTKGWRFEGESNGEYMFSDPNDPRGNDLQHIPVEEVRATTVRPHKQLEEIQNISGKGDSLIPIINDLRKYINTFKVWPNPTNQYDKSIYYTTRLIELLRIYGIPNSGIINIRNEKYVKELPQAKVIELHKKLSELRRELDA